MLKSIGAAAFCLLLGSCAGLPREGWVIGGPSIEKGIEIRLEREADGTETAAIRSAHFGDGVVVRGFVASGAGGAGGAVIVGGGAGGAGGGSPDSFDIELSEIRYFGNWPRGWTDMVLEARGHLRLYEADGRWNCEVLEIPAIGAVGSAEIRFGDEYLTGDRAAEAADNRMQRIAAAVAVWREGNPAWFVRAARKFRLSKPGWDRGFAEAAGPFFFPEIYGYPEGERVRGPLQGADGIRWDTGYSAERFGEGLRSVRDSGTLYRDWEEARDLWYFLAQWPFFWEYVLPGGGTEISAMKS